MRKKNTDEQSKPVEPQPEVEQPERQREPGNPLGPNGEYLGT